MNTGMPDRRSAAGADPATAAMMLAVLIFNRNFNKLTSLFA